MRRRQRVRAKRGPMINSDAAPPAITAKPLRRDEGLRKPQFNLRSRFRAAYRDGAWLICPTGCFANFLSSP